VRTERRSTCGVTCDTGGRRGGSDDPPDVPLRERRQFRKPRVHVITQDLLVLLNGRQARPAHAPLPGQLRPLPHRVDRHLGCLHVQLECPAAVALDALVDAHSARVRSGPLGDFELLMEV
jgi:hypothetical protein